eukprot:8622524-Heterocapsa_arctica.AAC.1
MAGRVDRGKHERRETSLNAGFPTKPYPCGLEPVAARCQAQQPPTLAVTPNGSPRGYREAQ